MRKMMTIALAVGAVLVANGVWAAGYNDAGCGIGGLAFRDRNSKGAQVIAGTTNQQYSQTSSITSGTSGCSESGMARRREELKQFVAINFRSLSRDLAAGKGEFASSFAGLMGCQGEAAGRLLQFTREQHESLFSQETTPQSFLEDMSSRVGKDAVLSAACTL